MNLDFVMSKKCTIRCHKLFAWHCPWKTTKTNCIIQYLRSDACHRRRGSSEGWGSGSGTPRPPRPGPAGAATVSGCEGPCTSTCLNIFCSTARRRDMRNTAYWLCTKQCKLYNKHYTKIFLHTCETFNELTSISTMVLLITTMNSW